MDTCWDVTIQYHSVFCYLPVLLLRVHPSSRVRSDAGCWPHIGLEVLVTAFLRVPHMVVYRKRFTRRTDRDVGHRYPPFGYQRRFQVLWTDHDPDNLDPVCKYFTVIGC